MSMVETNQIDDDGTETFDAGEQALFDSMRAADFGAPPAELDPEPIAEPEAKTPVVVDPAITPEPEDPDVETIKGADGKPALDTDGKPQKRVSFHKFKREEARRIALEDELNKSREAQTRIDERLKIINEALATPEVDPAAAQRQQAEEDPEPNPETHIFEHNAWLSRQLQKTRQTLESFQQTSQDRDSEVQLATSYQNAAAQFAQSEPLFAQAYVYMIQQRLNELEVAGVADPKLREQQVVREEKGLVQAALKDGVNPAERIFKMAKLRGFVAKTPEPAPKPAPAAAVPGALDAPVDLTKAPPTAPVVSVKEQVELIKNGQQAALSLSDAGGSAPSELTREMLANMPQEEFDDLCARLPKSKLRELLGG